MIEVNNLRFSYPGCDDVFEQIAFDLERGHCMALLGNNGAGKSTLIKCLNRILEPKEGVVEVKGTNVRSMKRGEIARTMAYVAQQSEGTQLTVFDAVLLGRKPYIKFNPEEEDLDVTEKALERMGLKHLALRYTDELSGGELQKVILARALAQKPEILLLDEPTSNLDLHNQHEVLETVSRIVEEDNISAVVIIHDINLALRYCDRFLLIHDGKVYKYGDSSVIDSEAIFDVYHVKASMMDFNGRKLVVVD